MKKLLVIMILGLLFSNSLHAYTVKGSVSCGTIISSYEKDASLTRGMMIAFVNGYFTGRNYETNADVGKGTDNESRFYALLKYCRENPLKKNYHGAEHIYNKLK
tara:strand:+ start:169 stop:480 length:312 start_codon:yes stop_codon:yes gene_type:complete